MSTDPSPQSSEPRVIIRYPNLSGALVLVREYSAITYGYSYPRTLYQAECTGCLDEYSNPFEAAVKMPRRWADEHSAACRALSQPERADQPGGTA